MTVENFDKDLKRGSRIIRLSFVLLILNVGALFFHVFYPNFFEPQPKQEIAIIAPIEIDEDRIENGIHVRTGLIEAEGMMSVVTNCTSCHSSKIIIQNRMTADGWNKTIKWMQETQNLWDLGENQEIIVNYLVTNYPVKAKGRRENLSGIDWYELDK
jgi:hypothetical protein